MIALSLLDIKMLTTNLFVQDMFDKFYMTEAEITTFAAFHIDGRRRKEYYSQDELEVLGDRPYCLWSCLLYTSHLYGLRLCGNGGD